MAKFKPYNVNRKLNIKLDINHIVNNDHLCKQIEHIVSTLDTSGLEDNYSAVGQNALHPRMMLSIVFYGYAIGVRSGRKLATSCQENLPFIYLSKGYFPKKTVLNEFRRKNYLYFNDLFVQVLNMASQQGIGDFTFSMADGTKIGANSSKRQTKTKEQFGKWKASLLEDILEIEKELLEEKINLEDEGVKKNYT
jgi:transposase